MSYPRKLNDTEKKYLFYILPEDKYVYNNYRQRLDSMVIIGAGRFGQGNCILGYTDDKPDLSYSSLPVFAAGQMIYDDATVQITVHEEYEKKIEYNISTINGAKMPVNKNPIKSWSYSYWNAGDPSPFDNDELRQIDIGKKFMLVISKANKSIWVHEYDTKYNHIIPVSNFINELLRGNREIDKTRGIDMNYVIENNGMLEDDQYIRTLVQYNKQWRRLDLSSLDERKLPINKKKLLSLFRKKRKP